jgi:hypothetical protein
LGFRRLPYLNLLEHHIRKWRKEEKKDYDLVVTTNGQKGINVEKKKITLENNDEELVEASTQRNEEELINLKE